MKGKKLLVVLLSVLCLGCAFAAVGLSTCKTHDSNDDSTWTSNF